jgi:hypothetical protein
MAFGPNTYVMVNDGSIQLLSSLTPLSDICTYGWNSDSRIIPVINTVESPVSVSESIVVTMLDGYEIECDQNQQFLLYSGIYKYAYTLSPNDVLMSAVGMNSNGYRKNLAQLTVGVFKPYSGTSPNYIVEPFPGNIVNSIRLLSNKSPVTMYSLYNEITNNYALGNGVFVHV